MSLICGATKKQKLKIAGSESEDCEVLSKHGSQLTQIAKDYELLVEIGRACNGAAPIYMAHHRASGLDVAVRVVPLENAKISMSLLMQEVPISRLVRQANLLPVLSAFTYVRSIWIVTPLMGYGSCHDLIHAGFHSGIPELVIAAIARQVLKGLVYLHEAGIVHRSVRPSHILVSSSGHVCLTGMRNAVKLDVSRGTLQDGRGVTFDYPLHSLKSMNYYSPELLRQNLGGYGTKSDMYSLGVTLCELANGVAPFNHMTPPEMLFAKLSGVMPRLLDKTTMSSEPDADKLSVKSQIDRQFSSEFHDFAELCCQPDPQYRPAADELLSHGFLKAVDRLHPDAIPPMLQPVRPLTRAVSLATQVEAAGMRLSEAAEGMSVSSTLDLQWDFTDHH